MAIIEEEMTLMSNTGHHGNTNHLWFVDSGCSNHMTGSKGSFSSLDECFKMEVRLGDKKKLKVEGRGIVKIHVGSDMVKLLENVDYAPKLEYNLLSVGQLMKMGYTINYDDGKCIINNKKKGRKLMEICVAGNNMFVLDATSLIITVTTPFTKRDAEGLLWHCRFKHLNFDGLKMLHEKKMVHGLPNIKASVVCEACLIGKQPKLPF